MMTLAPMLAAALMTAAPPAIEMALAERTGPKTARLTLIRADPRLEALCLDVHDGLNPALVESAREEALKQPLWLYHGGRRIGRGTLERLESGPSPFAPCAVVGEASFDEVVPLVARADVLWASTDRRESFTRSPVRRDAWPRARAALPAPLAEACLKPTAASARQAREGAWVSLVCSDAEGSASAVVFVPAKGEPRVALMERTERPLVLVEVLDATAKGARVVLGRELESGRRVELWSLGAAGPKRIDGWRAY